MCINGCGIEMGGKILNSKFLSSELWLCSLYNVQSVWKGPCESGKGGFSCVLSPQLRFIQHSAFYAFFPLASPLS